jgi:uroporphyrinogen decarboxylase
MMEFKPDFTNIVMAAWNIKPKRLPLYEHGIGLGVMESILNRKFKELFSGDESDKREFLRCFCEFYKFMGYDAVSFDQNIGSFMPGSGALVSEKCGVIKTRDDFEKYPWDDIPKIFFEKTSVYFRLLGEVMPEGMKAMGGPGNGIFECVQDLVGYTQLCYISMDDPELFDDLFKKVGETNYKIWSRFLKEFGDTYAVCRFGDDLGFKSGPLLSPDDIRTRIIPQYKKIIELIHSYGKPFVYHSCGCIFEVMDDIISEARIDAKHSNEDVIAPFTLWVDRYGDRIGNFGGIDVDVLCRSDEQTIKDQSRETIEHCIDRKGFAFGSGNSIADYVPVAGYCAMVEAAREYRGE